MTPERLAQSNSEHAHQQALFAWAGIALRYGFAAADDERSYSEYGYLQQTYGINPREVPNPSGRGKHWEDDGGRETVPELEWLHAIPNGGRRDGFTAALMKAEGVKKGICDIFLPLPMRWPGGDIRYCGFYIELKRPTSGKAQTRKQKGTTSTDQDAFIAYGRNVGYAVSVAFGWQAATREVKSYVETVRATSRR